jgi:tripartite-type tricarboxylate transporter receptor subunit TctC
MPYDALKDLVPITFVALSAGYVVVAHPGFAARSMKDVIELAKNTAKPVAYSTAGIGNSTHLVTEMFSGAAGISMTHVPYKGVSPALNAVLAGEVQLMFIPPTSAVQHIQSGRARALAYTGKARWSVLPEVPTIAEAGVTGYNAELWFCLVGPAKMPATIATRIADDIAKIVKLADVKTRLDQQGMEAVATTPAQLQKFMTEQNEQWSKVVRAAGVKAE